MATTESRSGFRLPWSPERAPSRDGSEEDPADESRPGDPELPASELEATEARHPGTDPDAGAAADSEAVAAEALTIGPDDRAAMPVVPVAAIAPHAAPGVGPAPVRRPSKFLVDLTHAMQTAAEQARAATLEQFRVEGSSYVEQIQGRSVADADALRRRADDDIASIKDWSKAEIARIREETESRVAGRRGQLDGQLARHAALVERDVARIEGQIASFEAEMAAFFDELLSETDLTVLAARAQQMPEAPAFDELDGSAFTALMTEPAVGIPVSAPEPEVEPEPTPEPQSSEGTAEAAADAETAPSAALASTGDLPFDRDAAMAAIQAAAEAAAELEAAAAETAPADASADPSAAEPAVDPRFGPAHAAGAIDPRLSMLGLTPDFAAAEVAAAEAAAAEVQGIPEMDEQNLTARLAGLISPTASSASPEEGATVPVASTQVIVTGLVSVASIASFKRHLSRVAGVRHVGVSSGPDGEFVFAVQHETDVSLRDLIPALPGFQARVTGGGDGVVTASAHDPED